MASSLSDRPYEVSSAITDDDRGPVITVAASICLLLSLFLLLVRGWIRWPWNGLAGLDDYGTLIATIFGVIQTVVVISAVQAGLGQTKERLDDTQIASASKLLYASDILFALTLWIARLAVAFLFVRLSSTKDGSSTIYRYLIGILAILGIASVLVIAFREDVSAPWLYPLSQGTVDRWTAVGILGMLAETMLLACAIAVVWNLQMTRKNKANIVSGFAMRFTTVIFIGVRLTYLRRASSDPDNFTLAYVLPEFLTQLEMHFSLICATVPCLRIFLRSFNTGFNVMDLDHVDPTASRAATKGGGDSINLSTLRSMDTKLRANNGGMTTSKVTHGIREERASMDSDRSDRRIFVSQTVNVESHYDK